MYTEPQQSDSEDEPTVPIYTEPQQSDSEDEPTVPMYTEPQQSEFHIPDEPQQSSDSFQPINEKQPEDDTLSQYGEFQPVNDDTLEPQSEDEIQSGDNESGYESGDNESGYESGYNSDSEVEELLNEIPPMEEQQSSDDESFPKFNNQSVYIPSDSDLSSDEHEVPIYTEPPQFESHVPQQSPDTPQPINDTQPEDDTLSQYGEFQPVDDDTLEPQLEEDTHTQPLQTAEDSDDDSDSEVEELLNEIPPMEEQQSSEDESFPKFNNQPSDEHEVPIYTEPPLFELPDEPQQSSDTLQPVNDTQPEDDTLSQYGEFQPVGDDTLEPQLEDEIQTQPLQTSNKAEDSDDESGYESGYDSDSEVEESLNDLGHDDEIPPMEEQQQSSEDESFPKFNNQSAYIPSDEYEVPIYTEPLQFESHVPNELQQSSDTLQPEDDTLSQYGEFQPVDDDTLEPQSEDEIQTQPLQTSNKEEDSDDESGYDSGYNSDSEVDVDDDSEPEFPIHSDSGFKSMDDLPELASPFKQDEILSPMEGTVQDNIFKPSTDIDDEVSPELPSPFEEKISLQPLQTTPTQDSIFQPIEEDQPQDTLLPIEEEQPFSNEILPMDILPSPFRDEFVSHPVESGSLDAEDDSIHINELPSPYRPGESSALPHGELPLPIRDTQPLVLHDDDSSSSTIVDHQPPGELPIPFRKEESSQPIKGTSFIDLPLPDDKSGKPQDESHPPSDLPIPFREKESSQPIKGTSFIDLPLQTIKSGKPQDESPPGDLPIPFREKESSQPIKGTSFIDLPLSDDKSKSRKPQDKPSPSDKSILPWGKKQSTLSPFEVHEIPSPFRTTPPNIPLHTRPQVPPPSPTKSSHSILPWHSHPSTDKSSKPSKQTPLTSIALVPQQHFPEIPVPFRSGQETGATALLTQLQREFHHIKHDCFQFANLLNRYIELYPSGIEFKRKFNRDNIKTMIRFLHPDKCPKNKFNAIINWLQTQLK
jgi:hypothetical protein